MAEVVLAAPAVGAHLEAQMSGSGGLLRAAAMLARAEVPGPDRPRSPGLAAVLAQLGRSGQRSQQALAAASQALVGDTQQLAVLVCLIDAFDAGNARVLGSAPPPSPSW